MWRLSVCPQRFRKGLSIDKVRHGSNILTRAVAIPRASLLTVLIQLNISIVYAQNSSNLMIITYYSFQFRG